jgi:nucleoside-diphosphate-sugar epimerase
MKVLVSGAGGFLGRYTVNRLLEKGHSVRALIRPESAEIAWPAGVETFRADLRVHDDLVPAFDGVDAVIHLAAATSGSEDIQFASTVMGTERFLEAMGQSSVKRLVHVSSLVVYDWGRAKDVMDENTPLVTDIYDMGPYTIAKIWQERVVARLAEKYSFNVTMMRPGFIWGPGHVEIAGMGRRYGSLYLMFGPLTRLPLSHVVNCADCLVSAVESEAASNQAFNVIDGDEVSVWRYAKEYARRSGHRGFFVPLPYMVGLGLAHAAALTSRALFGKRGKLPSILMPRRFQWQFKPIRFSNRKARQLLKWAPIVGFNESLDLSFG